MTVGGVTVPGWVTVSACRTKGKGQACFISALTHVKSHKHMLFHVFHTSYGCTVNLVMFS